MALSALKPGPYCSASRLRPLPRPLLRPLLRPLPPLLLRPLLRPLLRRRQTECCASPTPSLPETMCGLCSRLWPAPVLPLPLTACLVRPAIALCASSRPVEASLPTAWWGREPGPFCKTRRRPTPPAPTPAPAPPAPAPPAPAPPAQRPPTHIRVLRLANPFTRGDDVRAVQQALARAGFSVVADGVFGPATDRAVRQFQASRRLTVDGIVGSQTRARLGV
jgi:hypothetical protein